MIKQPGAGFFFLLRLRRSLPLPGIKLVASGVIAGAVLLAALAAAYMLAGSQYAAGKGTPRAQESVSEPARTDGGSLPASAAESTMNMPVSQLPPVLNQEEGPVNEAVPKLERRPGKLPLPSVVRQHFGWQLHPVYGDWRYHTGVDIDAEQGSLVRALEPGVVTEVTNDKQAGLTVAVKNGARIVYYGSLESASARSGERVAAGDELGRAGTSPAEPFPHVHVGIREDGKNVDPLSLTDRPEE